MAVGLFNEGHVFLRRVIEKLGYVAGQHFLAAIAAADKERIRKTDKACTEESKEHRKKKKKQKKARKEDAAIEQEGTTYEAGAFGPDGREGTTFEAEAFGTDGTVLRVSGGTAQPKQKKPRK